jgi:hypothetical protein
MIIVSKTSRFILPTITTYVVLRITNIINPFVISLSLLVGVIFFFQAVVSQYNIERRYYSLNN